MSTASLAQSATSRSTASLDHSNNNARDDDNSLSARKDGADGSRPEFQWVKATDRYIPPKAVQGGIEKTGEPLYIARAFFHGGLHPGKAGKHLSKGFSMSFDSKEINLSEYYVLCGNASRLRWVEQNGPVVIGDFTPVPGGHESGGETVRSIYNGSQQIGKCASHLKKGMVFGYGGKEKNEGTYNILAYV
ncbi:hypothetical protein EV182_004153 [Spiromyces aspiralis]|uniref:Uncharacterized protein n=1 Tax=Spiromyces aspiralis TaxID=68401 RepID=A0ACC1HPB8_9FUNG|nr:hypothetical protein EV182_004153 [Spiromyces aspiralis]